MEMASKAIGRLAMAGDTFTAEYVEFEVKRALEWLGADRNEGRRHAAVSSPGLSPARTRSSGALLCVLGKEFQAVRWRQAGPQDGRFPSLVSRKEHKHQPG